MTVAFSAQLINSPSDKESFVLFVISPIVNNFLTVFVLSPEIFRTAVAVVSDDLISRLKDGFSRAIVFLKQDYLGFWVILFKVQDILHIGSPPAIDRLVSISDHADILKAGSQELDQLVLGMVGILILVHMDVLVTLLVVGQDVRILVKKAQSQHNQIVKIHSFGLTQFLLIGRIALGYNLCVHITSHICIGHLVNQIVLSIGNRT
ncbi:malonate transporter [Streptococcus cristatus]|uniref:Malonate transporter n=1 Tax=Streptococcus cristatus TaxID=45634 RepID=A0A139N2R2_STRCR|nr:malonate transporter [Streptococcus cristatus]